jgi:hypothetical protein
MAKRVLNHAYDGPLAVGLELEGLAYGLLRTTDDFREGVEAFFEKRPPKFTRPLDELSGAAGSPDGARGVSASSGERPLRRQARQARLVAWRGA